MASTITITCPECDKLLKVPSAAEGKKVRCSACDATFVARSEVDEIEVVEEDRPARPKAKAKAPAKAPGKAPAKAPAKKANPDDPFAADTAAFGMIEEYLGRRCPDCANAIGEEDRICLSCGYDTVSREKSRVRKVQHVTGFSIFLWILPAVLCAILSLAILGGLVWMIIKVDMEMFGEAWYAFIGHAGMKVYACTMGLFIVYKAGRFAIGRLIYNRRPPEVELKFGQK